MKSKLLVLLLAISLVANAYFVMFEEQPSFEEGQLREMQTRISSLEAENKKLKMQINQENKLLQSFENGSQICPAGIEGFAILQGPAVFQKVELERAGPFIQRSVSEEGALLNISVEIRPGKGRVLVQTTPLMGVVFQDAANTAVSVAENKTGRQMSSSDIIFSITAPGETPGVDGPSAGALMTLLTISAINNAELNKSITLTGTIDDEGNIGQIGGVLEKAQASKAGDKTLFLIPRENSELVTYHRVERKLGGFTVIEQEPKTVDAKMYIEKEVGINVEYVDTIDDVLKYEKINV